MADGGASLLVGSSTPSPETEIGLPDEAVGVEQEIGAQLAAYQDFKNAVDDEEGLLALKDLIAMLSP